VNKVANKSDILKNRLIYEITTGAYRFGDRLDSERELSGKYGVSRNTLRQALEKLTSLQILKRRSRQGTYVSLEALDIISQDIANPQLSVLFMMPTEQVGNPLLSKLFMTCQSRIESNVKISILFRSITNDFLDNPLKVDILVAFGCEDYHLLKKIEKKYKSLVLLNLKHDDFNYISPNNYSGGNQMARFIIENGHKEIGCIGFDSSQKSSDFIDRYQGVKDVFADANLEFNPYCFTAENYYKLDAYCHKAVETLLNKKTNITAFICLSDMLAVSVLNSCNLMNIRIPDDISIIGFDDQHYTQFTMPRLTTIKYPAEAMGIRLGKHINNIYNGMDDVIQESIVPVLIKRESVCTFMPESKNKKFPAVQAIPDASMRGITPEFPRPDGRAENLARVERHKGDGELNPALIKKKRGNFKKSTFKH